MRIILQTSSFLGKISLIVKWLYSLIDKKAFRINVEHRYNIEWLPTQVYGTREG